MEKQYLYVCCCPVTLLPEMCGEDISVLVISRLILVLQSEAGTGDATLEPVTVFSMTWEDGVMLAVASLSGCD